MGIVARLALNRRVALSMLARTPLIGGAFVTFTAQVCVRGDWHGRSWMSGLEWAMTGFTGYTCLGIFASFWVVTGCVAFQAGDRATQRSPITLEDGRGECLSVAGGEPFIVNILVALSTGF